MYCNPTPCAALYYWHKYTLAGIRTGEEYKCTIVIVTNCNTETVEESGTR